MSDDWKVGDLAVCVDASPCRTPDLIGLPWPMKEGSVWRVCFVGVSTRGSSVGRPLLRFVGEPPMLLPHKKGWGTDRFRKILPDEPIACETEFRILLDLSKKRVKA